MPLSGRAGFAGAAVCAAVRVRRNARCRHERRRLRCRFQAVPALPVRPSAPLSGCAGMRGGGMSTTVGAELIKPHGGQLLERSGPRPEGVDDLETLVLTARELADLDMLASGALSPLQGFMGAEDYERVVEDMQLANGLAWALPVCLAVDAAPARLPAAGARPGGDPGRLRRARLEAGGRLPDPEPDPPGARVPDEGRARDRRRSARPPARRLDEVGRRPGRDARRVLPRPARAVLPGRPRRDRELPGRDALRGAAGGDLARYLPQELRLLALHRRPRPRGRRRLLRHLRRAARFRRVRAARARHRADVLRARLLVPRLRPDGDAEDVPARRRRPRLPLGHEGAGDALR